MRNCGGEAELRNFILHFNFYILHFGRAMLASTNRAQRNECECLTRHIGEANTSYAVGILHSEATSFAHRANFIQRIALLSRPSFFFLLFSFFFFLSSFGRMISAPTNRAKRNECECLTRHIGEANTSYAVGILHSEATSFAHRANFIQCIALLSRPPFLFLLFSFFFRADDIRPYK